MLQEGNWFININTKRIKVDENIFCTIFYETSNDLMKAMNLVKKIL